MVNFSLILLQIYTENSPMQGIAREIGIFVDNFEQMLIKNGKLKSVFAHISTGKGLKHFGTRME